MLELSLHADGVLLPVKAQAGARRNEIRAPQGGALKVLVTQAPEKGKANKAIIDLLASKLGLRKSQLRLHSGASSSSKKFLIASVKREELRARIQSALSDSS